MHLRWNAILTENWLEFREDITSYERSMVSVFDNDTTEWNSDGKMLNESFQIFCLHRIQNITMKIVQTFTYAIHSLMILGRWLCGVHNRKTCKS